MYINVVVDIFLIQEIDELMKSLRDHFVSEIKDYEILEVTREHRMTYYPF